MVDNLKKTEKYFAVVFWTKGGQKRDKELLDYFDTTTEAEKEIERQKEIDKHESVRYEYEVLERTGKQIIEMW